MKTFCLTTVIALFLLFISNRMQAQTTQTKLILVVLAKQFLGTWQENTGKDTDTMVEGKLYGKALITNVYMVIKGKKSDSYLSCFGYDDRDDKIKGYNLITNADFATWIGVFTMSDLYFELRLVEQEIMELQEYGYIKSTGYTENNMSISRAS
jgi:hypothetical protein